MAHAPYTSARRAKPIVSAPFAPRTITVLFHACPSAARSVDRAYGNSAGPRDEVRKRLVRSSLRWQTGHTENYALGDAASAPAPLSWKIARGVEDRRWNGFENGLRAKQLLKEHSLTVGPLQRRDYGFNLRHGRRRLLSKCGNYEKELAGGKRNPAKGITVHWCPAWHGTSNTMPEERSGSGRWPKPNPR